MGGGGIGVHDQTVLMCQIPGQIVWTTDRSMKDDLFTKDWNSLPNGR